MSQNTPIIIKKKKVHGHGGHHGGSWKVAYADFVTAMMAFFMVMWIMGLSAETKSIVQGYFNDPLGFMKSEPRSPVNLRPPGGAPQTTMEGKRSSGDGDSGLYAQKVNANNLKKELESGVEGSGDASVEKLLKGLHLSVTDEGLEIEFAEDHGVVFFESGSAIIRPVAAKLLERVSPILAASGRRMIIDGHTDARPYPSQDYDNWDLSSDRAMAIRRALKSGGVKEDQILGVRAFADTRLKDTEHPYHFSNRRVTILLPYKNNPEATFALPGEVVKDSVQGAFRDTP